MTDLSSTHFSLAELACHCGCGLVPPADFIAELERLRTAFDRPMPINSGARCARYNQIVSTTGAVGPHTIGAVDVAIESKDAFDLVKLALEMGWTGIGLRQKGTGRFVHLDRVSDDRHPRPRFWNY